MLVSVVGVASFVVPLGLALAVGRGQRRQLALALAGLVFCGAWIVWALTFGCAEGYSCTGAVIVFGTFGLIWLAGVGAASLVRGDRGRPGWRTLLVAAVLLLFVGVAAAYGRYEWQIVRWGCPSQAELDRLQSVEDVTSAFARHDLPLESIQLPVWLPPAEPAYRGARAFRHAPPGATVYVLVCRQRCAISRFRFGEARKVGEQRWRLGLDSNNNVPIWVTEADRRAGRRMLAAIAPVLREVHPYIEYGSRCYIR